MKFPGHTATLPLKLIAAFCVKICLQKLRAVEGVARFDESETHILIENLTAAPLSRFDLLGAGGGGWSAESIKWYLNGAKLAGAWTPDPPF